MLSALRFAFRQLIRSPLHTTTVVLILGLGIGANTAIFSLVQSVLLKPLPYPEPDQITVLRQQQRGGDEAPFSWPNLQDVRRDNHSFAAVGAYHTDEFTITGRGSAEQVRGTAVNADFFSVLRLPPLLGRAITAADDIVGAPKVVVLHESFWRRKLGGNENALGQTLNINAEPYTIVGVMPDAVINPAGTQFWIPIAPLADNDSWRNRRNEPGLFAFGRLRDGVTLQQAQADLLMIGGRLQHDFPEADSGITPVTRPLLDAMVGTYRQSLVMLMGAVGLLLVIACANVATLQLMRGLNRTHELSIRAALGAGRAPLIRLLLIESLVLAVFGGALGLLLAFWSVDGIRALSPVSPRFHALAVDRVALAFSVALSLGTGILSGLWPAWRASRVDLRDSLHAGGQKGGGARSQFGRQAMVALQVALTVILVAGAGLFLRSLGEIGRFQYGFDPSNLLLVNVSVPDRAGHYDTDEKRIAFFESTKRRIAALPGVKSVGLNYSAPLRMDWSQIFDIEGRPESPAGQEPAMEMGIIDPDYFPTLGLPILQGRNFDTSDRLEGPHGIIIDQRMADTFWPGQNPIGKIVLRGNRQSASLEHRRSIVIGVVPTIAVDGISDGPRLFQAYLAQAQTGNETMHFIIRTNVAPRSIVESVRATIAASDPNVPAFAIATMDELIASQSESQRLYSLLVALFAGAALLLSGLGLYGVVAHAVAARRREIGIRMALGALSRQVVALVLRQGALSLALGLTLGIGGSLVSGRLIAGLLYHVSPYDPLTLLGAALVLGSVGFVSLWLPARKAAAVDPMIALRAE